MIACLSRSWLPSSSIIAPETVLGTMDRIPESMRVHPSVDVRFNDLRINEPTQCSLFRIFQNQGQNNRERIILREKLHGVLQTHRAERILVFEIGCQHRQRPDVVLRGQLDCFFSLGINS